MADKNQKIGESEDRKIGATDDQQVSDSAEPVVQSTSEPENQNTDQTDSTEPTDTPTTTDTAETPVDEVSEQIPEPEVSLDESEKSEESEQSEKSEQAETKTKETADTLDSDVAEEAADTSSDNQDVVIPSDREESLDSTPEIATSPSAPRNDEKESADSSIDQTDSTEPSDDSEPSDNSDSPIAPVNDNPNAKWYVVHTFSGHENKVATNLKQRIDSEHLENRIIDILVPTQDKIEIRGGKKEQVKEKIFPGYILVKMDLDDASWLAVRTTQGVTAFVGMNNKPTPISEREVQSIVKFMTQGAPATFKDVFMVDDTVKIIDGPFTDFIGKVESVDKEKGKVRVLVSIFGRETPVELDFLQVTKL